MPQKHLQIVELPLLLKLLDDDPRNSAEIARAAGVGYFWLRKLRTRKTKAPSFEPTRKLLLFLYPDEEVPGQWEANHPLG